MRPRALDGVRFINALIMAERGGAGGDRHGKIV